MLKGWRRRRILSRHTIPDELWSTVVVDVPAIARLDADAMLARTERWCAINSGTRNIAGVRAMAPGAAFDDGRLGVAWVEAARPGSGPIAVARIGRLGRTSP